MSPTGSFWCPIPAAINPLWRQFEHDAVAWAERMRLDDAGPSLATLARIGAGELAGRSTVTSPRAETAQIAADLLLWLFAFDDRYCDAGLYRASPLDMAVLVADAVRVIDTGRVPSDDSCLVALGDLRRRVRAAASPAQFVRWAGAFRAYLGQQVWEAAVRAAGVVPALDQYLVARIRSGSMEMCLMTLDIAGGYEVPGADLVRPEVVALMEIVSLLVGLDNDLLSYRKEHRGAGDVINVVDVVAAGSGLGHEESLRASLEIRDRLMALFLHGRARIGADLGPQTHRFLEDLSHWVRGNLDWSLNSGRYGADGAVTDQRPHVSDEPLPGVAWWWEVLRRPAVLASATASPPSGW